MTKRIVLVDPSGDELFAGYSVFSVEQSEQAPIEDDEQEMETEGEDGREPLRSGVFVRGRRDRAA